MSIKTKFVVITDKRPNPEFEDYVRNVISRELELIYTHPKVKIKNLYSEQQTTFICENNGDKNDIE